MPSRLDEQPNFPIYKDILAARKLGFSADSPAALDLVLGLGEECPNIFFGPDKRSIFDLNLDTFAATCRSMPRAGDGTLQATYPAEQLHIDDSNMTPGQGWDKMVDVALRHLLQTYGLRVGSGGKINFRSSLRGLIMLGAGARTEFKSQDGDAGSLGNMLVEFPLAYRDGTILASREGQLISFDFSRFSSAPGGTTSYLHWFHDTTITIQPTSSGLRALLLYDVSIEPIANLPLVLIPDSRLMRSLEAKVCHDVPGLPFRHLHPKACYLPLVRILLSTYKAAKLEPPAICVELCSRVVSSYEKTIQDAINSGAERDFLNDIRNEGEETILSFGGKKEMRRLLGPRRVRALDKVMAMLDH